MSARIAAYEVLVELSSRCFNNLNCIAKQLIDMHHKNKPQNTKEWEVRIYCIAQNFRVFCRKFIGCKNFIRENFNFWSTVKILSRKILPFAKILGYTVVVNLDMCLKILLLQSQL
jgi:hypothetical protein